MPARITTDGLRRYGAAMDELGNREKQEIGRWANNRVVVAVEQNDCVALKSRPVDVTEH